MIYSSFFLMICYSMAGHYLMLSFLIYSTYFCFYEIEDYWFVSFIYFWTYCEFWFIFCSLIMFAKRCFSFYSLICWISDACSGIAFIRQFLISSTDILFCTVSFIGYLGFSTICTSYSGFSTISTSTTCPGFSTISTACKGFSTNSTSITCSGFSTICTSTTDSGFSILWTSKTNSCSGFSTSWTCSLTFGMFYSRINCWGWDIAEGCYGIIASGSWETYIICFGWGSMTSITGSYTIIIGSFEFSGFRDVWSG